MPTALGKAFSKLAKSAGKLLSALWVKLKPPLMRMFKNLFVAAKPLLVKMGVAWFKMMLIKMAIAGIASAVKGAVVAKIGGMISGMMGGAFGKAGKTMEKMSGPGGKIGKGMKKGMGPMTGGVSGFLKSIGSIKITDMIKAAFKLGVMSTVFFPALLMLAVYLKVIAKVIGLQDALAAAAAMLAIAVAIGAMKFAIDAGSKISLGSIGKAILGLAGAALVLISGALVFSFALRAISGVFKGVDWIGVGIAMLGIAVAMGAVAAMIWAASLVPKEMIVMAAVNMATAALFVGAVALFSLAMMVAHPIVTAVPWMSLVMPMIGMVAVVALLVATAFISQAMAPLGIPGSIGLGAALIFTGALTLFSMGLKLLSPKVAELLPFMPMFITFASAMALIMVALVATAAASIAMIPLGLIGSLGMITSGVFLNAIVVDLIPGLKGFAKEGAGLPFGKLATAFGAMALIMPALVIIAAQAIIAGVVGLIASFTLPGVVLFLNQIVKDDGILDSLRVFSEKVNGLDFTGMAKAFGAMALSFLSIVIIAAQTIPAGILGLIASFFLGGVVKFVDAMNEDLIPSLSTLSTKIAGIPSGSEKKLGVLGKMFGVLAQAAELSMTLVIFALPIIGHILNKAMGKIPEFADKVIEYITPSIMALDAMQLTDPGGLQAKVDAIGKLMEVIASLAGVAATLMDVDTDSLPADAGSPLQQAGDFMDGLFCGVNDIVEVLSGTPLTPAQIQSAAAIGNVLGAIGDMVKAVAPSPELIKALRTESTSWGGLASETKTDTAAIEALASYMDSMMGTISAQIPKVMTSIMEAVSMIPSGGNTGKKIKLVAEAFTVISVLAGAISDIMGVVPKQRDPKKQAEMLKSVIDAVNGALFGDGGNIGALKKAFDGLREVVNSVPAGKSFAAKVPIVAEAFGVLGSFAGSLGDIIKLMPKEVEGSKEFGPRLKALLDPGGLMDGIVKALAGDSGMLMKIFDTLKGAIDQMPGDAGSLKSMATKVTILGDMFGVVGQFASAMADIGGLIPNVEGQPPPPLSEAIDFCTKIVDALVGTGGDGMLGKLAAGLLTIVTQEGTKDLYKYRRQIKGLGEAFEVIGVFAKNMGDLAGLSTGEGAGAAGITSMLSNLASAYGTGMSGNNDIINIIGGFATIGKEAGKARLDTRSMQKASCFAVALSDTLTAMANMPAQIEVDTQRMADQFAQISAMFASAGEGSDFAIAVAVAQGLSEGGECVITHENMQINLTVQVDIGADALAKGTIKALGQVNGQPGYKTFAPMGAGE